MKNWAVVESCLQPGDIVLVHYTGPAGFNATKSDGIEWFSGKKASHCGTYIGNGQIVEAMVLGVVVSKMAKYYGDAYALTVRRLEVPDREMIAASALTHVGKTYDFSQIGVSGIYFLAGKAGLRGFQAWVRNKWRGWRASYTCSESCTVAVWQAVGVDLFPTLDYGFVSPGMLLETPLLTTVCTAD